MREPDFLLFANDAELLALSGGALILLAGGAVRLDPRPAPPPGPATAIIATTTITQKKRDP